MAQFFSQQHHPPPRSSSSNASPYGPTGGNAPPNLQFYPSSYTSTGGGGGGIPSHAPYGGGGAGYGPTMAGTAGGGYGVGVPPGVSGRMGEQGGLRTGWLAAFGTEGYDGEPPLMEELGVNFGHIKVKTLTVLNPFARIDQHLMDDSDLAGPILFFLLFGTFLLFSGKVHFGYIYGLALLGSTSLHVILSLMSPPLLNSSLNNNHHHHHHRSSSISAATSSHLTLSRSASVLGYCLLPLVLTSLIGVILPLDAALGYVLTSAAIIWCTYSSSGMFCAVGRMRGMRGLVAYPLALFYVGFGIMALFSSRGAAAAAAAKAAGVVGAAAGAGGGPGAAAAAGPGAGVGGMRGLGLGAAGAGVAGA